MGGSGEQLGLPPLGFGPAPPRPPTAGAGPTGAAEKRAGACWGGRGRDQASPDQALLLHYLGADFPESSPGAPQNPDDAQGSPSLMLHLARCL